MEGLKSAGWHVAEEAYQKCLEQSNNKFSVTDILLNTDIKEVALASLPCDFAKSKPTKLTGPLVVQIQKVKNISAPTIRQESSTAPRMFKFSLSDGCQTVPAIEMESLHNVGFGTAPGSKLQLKGTTHVNQGIILLTNSNCKLLGGKVDAMYEKWQLNKDLMKLTRKANRSDGPPPFLQLGQKVKKDKIEQLQGKFNSLEVASATPSAVEKDNAEFDAQRQAVISEALRQQEKRTYGGIKQVDAHAPLERTEFKRPDKKTKKPTLEDKDPNVSDDEDQGRGRGRRGRRGRNLENDEGHLAPGRPSTANTLFDFLGNRFAGDDDASKSQVPKTAPTSNFHEGGYDRRSHDSDPRYRHTDSRQHGAAQHQKSHGSFQQNRPTHNQQRFGETNQRSQANGYSREQPLIRNDSQATQKSGSSYNSHQARGDNSYGKPKSDNFKSNQTKGNYTDHSNEKVKENPSFSGARKGDNSRAQRMDNNSNAHRQQQENLQTGSRKEAYRQDNNERLQNSHQASGSNVQTKKPSQTGGDGSVSVVGQPRQQNQSMKKADSGRFSGKMYSDDMRAPPEQTTTRNQGPANSRQRREDGGETSSAVAYNSGDVVMAKYWEDGQFYRFQVSAQLSPTVVRGVFIDYGNMEEVYLKDIKPVRKEQHRGGVSQTQQQATGGKTQFTEYKGDYSQGLTFSRSGGRSNR